MTAQPGGREPAPSHLAPLQDLLNTVNLESGEDALAEPTFDAWARDRGVGDATEADRVRLQRLREDLRHWVESSSSAVPAAVGDAVERARLRVGVVDGRLRTTSTTPYGRLVADVVEGIRTAQEAGDWERLKTCSRSSCRWAFYDHSRNNRSRWCSSSICGAREKSVRAYRRRAHGAPTPPPTS